ncbi:MAG TPA: hypothetical protein VEY91_13765 [Candidatus Limnocylindria bacterium]|nr:hypothetical protein [Candidatus Limnocylindria bacterium]
MDTKKDDKRSPMVTGMFPNRQSAEQAYRSLSERGYQKDDVHIMMSDETRKRYFVKDDKNDTDLGNKALEGTGVGAAVGGAVGATLLGILAAGAAVTIPGVGLVIAGPLAGAIAGAGAGATAGGVVGALVGAGIPEDRAKVYETGIKQGGIVMGVTPRSPDDAQYFEKEWTTHGESIRR